MRVVVTRPEPDASALAERLAQAGHTAILAPLMAIEPVAAGPWPTGKLAAFAATSRHAALALDPPKSLQSLPFYAVGTETAGVAQARGWTDVRIANGTASDLADLLIREQQPGDGAIVYGRAATVTLDLKTVLAPLGFTVIDYVLYQTCEAARMPENLRTELLKPDPESLAITLLSARTAQCYARLCGAGELVGEARKARHYCLSKTIAAALEGIAPATAIVAERPDLEHILARINLDAAQFRLERSPR